jgi:hypothetical protein
MLYEDNSNDFSQISALAVVVTAFNFLLFNHYTVQRLVGSMIFKGSIKSYIIQYMSAKSDMFNNC